MESAEDEENEARKTKQVISHPKTTRPSPFHSAASQPHALLNSNSCETVTPKLPSVKPKKMQKHTATVETDSRPSRQTLIMRHS